MKEKKRTQKKSGQYTCESWLMANGEKGTIFYSSKRDKSLTAIATYYKRRIKTERIIAVTGSKAIPTATNLTKVTLL